MMKCLTICFTGHRPKYLPWGTNETLSLCTHFKDIMRGILKKAILNGYQYFISGIALGVDMICAEIVLELKIDFPNILLECAIPCIDQEKYWDTAQQVRYHKILQKADSVHYTSRKPYFYNCMQERNLYMLKKSDAVIAVSIGKSGGTANAIRMAKILNKKVRIINPYNPK